MELNINVLKGKVLSKVFVAPDYNDNEKIVFETANGEKYEMYHYQGCCETVEIADIVGDLQDLVGSEILLAEQVVGESELIDTGMSVTWTFYKLATIKGYVDISWRGESNGHYSENVTFEKV